MDNPPRKHSPFAGFMFGCSMSFLWIIFIFLFATAFTYIGNYIFGMWAVGVLIGLVLITSYPPANKRPILVGYILMAAVPLLIYGSCLAINPY